MDFKEISDFFNGTICPEEYRTDLRKANDSISERESKLNTNPLSTTQDRATILILRSLYATMTGDLTQAENHLINLSTLAEEAADQSLISRCQIYQHHIRSLKYLPPFLRFRPEANTGTGPISDATLDGMGNLKRFVNFCSSRRESWTDMERLESEVIRSVHNLPNNLWMSAFHHHPNYNTNFCALLFDSSEACESRFIDNATSLGLLPTSRYMQRLNAEYLLAGGSAKGQVDLSILLDGYVTDGDFIGAGNCSMIRGDNALSLPFTSPIALNLYAVDTEFGIEPHNIFGVSKLIEQPLRKDEGAMSHYEEAYEYFDKGKSDRGKAAICLRYACLDFAEYIESLVAHESVPTSGPRPGDVRNSIHTQLEKASNLFKGNSSNTQDNPETQDGPNIQIVAGYRVLLNIILSDDQKGNDDRKTLEESAKIGKWGRDNGNIVISQFVGLLMQCVGKKISKNPRNLSMASHCFACSRACFHALEDYSLELQAIVAQAQLQKQHGNLEAARAYLETGHATLSQAVGDLQQLISNTSSEDYRQTLTMQLKNTVANFGQVASSIYGNDSRREKEWEKRRGEHLGPSTIEALVGSLPKNMFTGDDSSAATTSSSAPLGDIKSGTQPETLAAMLSDSSANIMETFQKFVSQKTSQISELQRSFDEAVEKRRVALVDHSDVDEADDCLRKFIYSLGDTAIINSLQVYSIETAALQYIGDFDTARRLLPRAIPNIFGGKLPISMPINAEPGAVEREILATQRKNHAERSIMMCYIAKDWRLGGEVLRKIMEELPKFFDEIRARKERTDWQLMTWIASLDYQNGDFESAFDWYLRALQVIEKTRSRLADDKDRRDIFATIHSAELFVGLAKTVLKFSDLINNVKFDQICDIWKFRGPTWMDEAALFLEKGRARVLLDLLTPEPVSTEFVKWKEWTHKLRETELAALQVEKSKASEAETPENWLANLKKGLDSEKESSSLAFIVKELQWTTDVTQLYHSIPADAIVIHINISRDGLLVLGITSSGVKLVHTSDTSDIEMQRHTLRFSKLIQHVDVVTWMPVKEDYEPMMETITILSNLIIRPISKVIANKSHIIFVPSRSLNKFPFSALLLDGKPIFLEKAISTVPSLSVLQQLVERERKRKRPETKKLKAAVTFRPPERKRDRPETKEPEKPLNLSAAASIEISQRLGCKPQSSHIVGVEEFSNSYQDSDVMLIATHGNESHESAWKASLSLKSKFQVLDVVKLQGRAALVVFEACLSGLGEESVGNDVLGFSYSILSSGASSFIGCLWKVSDLASAYLMSFLFVELLNTGSGSDSSFASCLRQAQKHMYEADASEVISVLRRFKTVCETVDTETKNKILSKKQQGRILDALDYTIEEEERSGTGGLTYAHPFYWAAFVLVGCGSLSL